MGLKEKFGTNSKLIDEGAWLELAENDDGSICRLRIKRGSTQNIDFIKRMANHRKAFANIIYSSRGIEQAKASVIEILIATIIVGWENVAFEDADASDDEIREEGKPKYLPFTPDNVRKVLIDLPDLVDFILEQSQDIKTFQKDGELKN